MGVMKLSIIIPTFNEAEILGTTLEGLKEQPAEIIVVDGGSEDATVKVASQYTPNVLICELQTRHRHVNMAT